MSNVRPFRCLDTRVLGVAVIAALIMVGLAWVEHGRSPGTPLRIVAGALQAVAFAWIMFEAVRSVRRLDELERQIHAEGLASAAIVTIVVMGGWGFLEKAGLPTLDWAAWAPGLLALLWVVEVVRVSRRYR